MAGKRYTTVEVARRAKVPRATLQYWIASGRISAPAVQIVEGKAMRLWTAADVERVRKLKGTLKKGPKTAKKK
jgi:DNA-binding transcriptional MerR regulator